jgi:coenzyme F420-reducing hydrogenase beta subunit
MCPFNNIEMKYISRKFKWEATIIDNVICTKCNIKDNCLSVCPSYNLNYINLANSQKNNLLGEIIKIYTGYSKNPEIRHNSSSGGFVRELFYSLIKLRKISIISISQITDMEYSPRIVKNIKEMPNSIYYNINYSKAFELIKNNDEQFLIIGLPCQITSLQLLINQKRYSYLKKRIYAKVSLFCGYNFDRINAYSFAYNSNFKLKQISFRNGGKYRKTIISNKRDFKLFDIINPKNINEKINNDMMSDKFLCQNGCLYCVDHIGYCSDISVGDAWLKRYNNDFQGANLIITRTKKGEDIVKNMKHFYFEKGAICDLIESQSNKYARGSIGEGIKSLKLNKYFYPNHIRIHNKEEIEYYKFSNREIIKIKFVKHLLIQKHFTIGKILYVILHYKKYLVLFIKQLLYN